MPQNPGPPGPPGPAVHVLLLVHAPCEPHVHTPPTQRSPRPQQPIPHAGPDGQLPVGSQVNEASSGASAAASLNWNASTLASRGTRFSAEHATTATASRTRARVRVRHITNTLRHLGRTVETNVLGGHWPRAPEHWGLDERTGTMRTRAPSGPGNWWWARRSCTRRRPTARARSASITGLHPRSSSASAFVATERSHRASLAQPQSSTTRS